jgi:hypothetical protein
VQITKALEQVLCGNVPQQLRLDGQLFLLFSRSPLPAHTPIV